MNNKTAAKFWVPHNTKSFNHKQSFPFERIIILSKIRTEGFVLRILWENKNEVSKEIHDPPSANKIPIG
jgi:hypothetical protein